MATYGVLGSTLTESGVGTAQIDSVFNDTWTVGGSGVLGSAVDLEVFFRLPGILTYDNNQDGTLRGTTQYRLRTTLVDLDSSVQLINDFEEFTFCGVNNSSPGFCTLGNTDNGAFSNAGMFSIAPVIQSIPLATTIGGRVRVSGDFQNLLVTGLATATSDFLDPASIYIEALDANSGAFLPGITITGDSGATYPVISSVPEQDLGTYLVGFAWATIIYMGRRRYLIQRGM